MWSDGGNTSPRSSYGIPKESIQRVYMNFLHPVFHQTTQLWKAVKYGESCEIWSYLRNQVKTQNLFCWRETEKIFHLHLDDDGQDCQCEPPLAPGCECNPDAADPDSFCPLDERWGDGRKRWWGWKWEEGWWCLQVSRLLSMQVLPRIFKLRLGTRPRWQGCSRIM